MASRSVARRTKVIQGHIASGNEKHQHVHASTASTYAENNERMVLGLALCDSSIPDPTSKVITADQAAALVPDGTTITVGGFVGCGGAETLLNAIRRRHDATSRPRNLSLVFGISVGDKLGRGTDALAKEGLVSSLTYAWIGTAPGLLKLVNNNKVTAWNLPFGAMSHLFRDIAANKPGPITKIGLGTFVDPREKGGKVNSATVENRVELVHMNGEEYCWYKAFPIHVALLRGTTADAQGNVSMEHEALYFDVLNQAMAAKNCGGLVIVQVERIAQSLPARLVHIPGVMVDHIVVSPPETHLQSFASAQYDPSLSGELRQPSSAIVPMKPGEKRIMAHRAMFELAEPNMLVNLGVGTPEGVSIMAMTHSHQNRLASSAILSTEAGSLGGTPGGGLLFGAAFNPTATLPSSTILDFYQGGAIGLACLGMAEVDCFGNVNVSNFGAGRMPGCGGFVDISQSAQKVIFMGTLTSGGLRTSVKNGKLVIEQEGKHRKFVNSVNEKTFAASSAGSRPVLYITERCVFRLTSQGLVLIEVAPGIEVENVLENMDFKPLIPTEGPGAMDRRIFEMA
eukprot:CAMPEP_0114259574 /NCGR_PEP_ID=MMETSP0058-20121206/19968_1 /TAXON_ID=36894 /ORGANISM="Pyramimonas parkeae, CCMP726" /LENGTH=568 /DNA_ID=CAMNT_0001374635 /DNA_START=153 /DNA_END=1859 /DNA_ORIENTATION=-